MNVIRITGPAGSGKTKALTVIKDGVRGKQLNITGVPPELVTRQVLEWGPFDFVTCDNATPEVIEALERLDAPNCRAYVVTQS